MKFNKRLRIKLSIVVLERLWKEHTPNLYFYEFRRNFCREAGLTVTSTKRKGRLFFSVYYYKIEDKQKYLLAKIKYGI